MSRHPAEKRHEACHNIDQGCIAMMQCVISMTESCFMIGGQDFLVKVRDALDALHGHTNAEHDKAIREMKN